MMQIKLALSHLICSLLTQSFKWEAILSLRIFAERQLREQNDFMKTITCTSLASNIVKGYLAMLIDSTFVG
jgi:hypothetical protein